MTLKKTMAAMRCLGFFTLVVFRRMEVVASK